MFSVDVGYHEIPLETAIIEFKSIGELFITTPEQMLCDKVSALYSDRRCRRIKDLFDAWHLLTTCNIDDYKFIKCLQDRNLYPLDSSQGPFTETCIEKMCSAYDSINIFSPVSDTEVSKPDFWEIVEVVGNFCCKFSDSEV